MQKKKVTEVARARAEKEAAAVQPHPDSFSVYVQNQLREICCNPSAQLCEVPLCQSKNRRTPERQRRRSGGEGKGNGGGRAWSGGVMVECSLLLLACRVDRSRRIGFRIADARLVVFVVGQCGLVSWGCTRGRKDGAVTSSSTAEWGDGEDCSSGEGWVEELGEESESEGKERNEESGRVG